MTTALLLVDIQEDYLSASTLTPLRDELVAHTASLLNEFRQLALPVAHIRTAVAPDGSTAMPHRRTAPRCVVGTPGIEPPAELREHANELVVTKQFFRGFVDPALDAWLIGRGVTRVVVAGLYTHACIRETVLDAYERGFEVVIAAGAIASDAPAHAIETLSWLGARAAQVLGANDVSALIAAEPSDASPDRWQSTRRAQREWASRPIAYRVAALEKLVDTLGEFKRELAVEITREVGKPFALAVGEVDRAIEHVRAAIGLADRVGVTENLAPGVDVTYEPVGVIAAIMPWNNPVALPLSKIAPALICGNTVVFKPSPLATHTAKELVSLMQASGIGPDLVRLELGDNADGARLVQSPWIDAVTVTGSIQTGRAIARDCVTLGKPIQAELGGNNAAIVLPDADLDEVVPALAHNAFVFAGQRCTAVRRFVVHADIVDEFTARMREQITQLTPGNAFYESTVVGPVVSEQAAQRILDEVATGHRLGAELLVEPAHFVVENQHYISPTLLLSADETNPLVQRETFGPVAVIQPARDLDQALELANGVEQGLVQFVCTTDSAAHVRIESEADVGILQFGPESLPVHADAPFAGWKASSIGTPEHGRWDLEFYQRPRARYSNSN